MNQAAPPLIEHVGHQSRILRQKVARGLLTLAIAPFAIPDRAVAAITVSGPADAAAAGDAVMAQASSQFRHASLISVKTVTASLQSGTSLFTVRFAYDASYGTLVRFVGEHRADRTTGNFEIQSISSSALNKWLIPLIVMGVISVAIGLGVAFKVRAIYRTA
jgi:hypothetical protein